MAKSIPNPHYQTAGCTASLSNDHVSVSYDLSAGEIVLTGHNMPGLITWYKLGNRFSVEAFGIDGWTQVIRLRYWVFYPGKVNALWEQTIDLRKTPLNCDDSAVESIRIMRLEQGDDEHYIPLDDFKVIVHDNPGDLLPALRCTVSGDNLLLMCPDGRREEMMRLFAKPFVLVYFLSTNTISTVFYNEEGVVQRWLNWRPEAGKIHLVGHSPSIVLQTGSGDTAAQTGIPSCHQIIIQKNGEGIFADRFLLAKGRAAQWLRLL